MFACSRNTANGSNPNSRRVACHVVTSRPSGVSRGVSLLTAPRPPSDAQRDEAALLEQSAVGISTDATSPSISEGAVQGLPSYAYLVTLMAGFSVIAFDVNAEDSLHLLQPLDTLVHTTVAQNIPFDFRANIADKLISDTPIHTGAAMVVGGLAVIATTRPKQAAALAGLYSIFNFSFGGVGFGKDASATSAVKKFFHRARPSDDLHHSFSFPSGHSTSAYFTLAFLFFVIVPALASWSASLSQPSDSSSQQPSTPASGTLSAVQGALQAAAKPKAALALTIGGGMITQSGRLLADVHWVSDVLAGALWGSSGVALACVIIEGLRSEPARSPAATGEGAAADAATREGERVSRR